MGKSTPSSRAYVTGTIAGSIVGTAVAFATTLVIHSTVGHMDYELSGLCAMVFGALGSVPASSVGVYFSTTAGPGQTALGILLGAIVGAFAAGMLYAVVVIPSATVPAVVVFWMGVVPWVAGFAAGTIGAMQAQNRK